MTGRKGKASCDGCTHLETQETARGWDPFILEQDRVWVDRHGITRALAEMTREHRAAVLGLLLDCAQQVWVVYHGRALVRLVEDVLVHGRVPGELLESELGVVPSHQMEPAAWLETMPLVRALRRHQRMG
ncbi:MAG: hypothetical protein U0S36_04570 [Candidatus Nanopelagicales bacterium]